MNRRLAGIGLYCLGVALLSWAVAVLRYGPEWTRPFLDLPGWFGLLLILDGLNGALRERSLLLDSPQRLLGLAAFSIPWWLGFELLNLRLKAWGYTGLPEDPFLRWSLYSGVFAALLPALAETQALLAAVLPLQRLEGGGFHVSEGLRDTLFLCGLAALALPLLWPQPFYPLLWAAPLLLVEPHLSRAAPLSSLLFELGMGRAEGLLSWGLAGLGCGLVWQAGNQWVQVRWISAGPPWGGGPELLGLPLAGYAGYALFGLGTAGAFALVERVWARAGIAGRAAAVFALSCFSAVMFAVLDARAALP